MPNLTQLRLAARGIFDEAVRAVDAGAAVARAIRLDGSQLSICGTTVDIANRNIYSIAIGKATFPMAYALEQLLGDSFTAGFMSGPVTRRAVPGLNSLHEMTLQTRWRWCEGGHPIPNRTSLLSATEAFALLQRANDERALVIFLISGGGSAMLEWPVNDEITL